MTSTDLSVYYIWKNIKSECNNKKFKISAQTWNDEFDENPPVQIYNKNGLQIRIANS